MSTEIKINLSDLKSTENKLSNLYKSISNHTLTVTLTNTKGEVAEEIMDTVTEINEIAKAFSLLVKNTEEVVKNTRQTFKEADTKLANLYKKEN